MRRSRAAIAAHCAAMVGFLDAGSEVFDYGNSLRAEARLGGFERAFAYPGFVPAYIRPLFCEGKGPFRWVALSGDPADIAATDRAVLEEFPDDEALARWIAPRIRADRVPGTAGADLLARLRRAPRGSACASTRWSAPGELRAPIVIGRDHLDSGLGRVALPRDRGDGRRVRRDRRLAAAERARSTPPPGASWVSIHHGGGVGIGRSIHAGMVCVADGTELAAEKLDRVLTTDPGHRGDAPRGRGLRARGRRRRRARGADPDAARQ